MLRRMSRLAARGIVVAALPAVELAGVGVLAAGIHELAGIGWSLVAGGVLLVWWAANTGPAERGKR